MVSNYPASVSSNRSHNDHHPIPDAETPPDHNTHETTAMETPADQSPSAPATPSYSSFPLKDVLETTKPALNLPENEAKALAELKLLLREALSKNELLPNKTPPPPLLQPAADKVVPPEEKTTGTADALTPPTAEKGDKRVMEEVVPDERDSTVTKSILDEDGANCKTVEAIEETIVSSSSDSSSSSVTHPLATDPVAEHPQSENPTSLSSPPPQPLAPSSEHPSIWGIPLLGDDEKTDVVLWKFLRARDFKPKEALAMLKATLHWRHQFKIDEMMTNPTDEFESEEKDLCRAVFMHGVSKEGHPVCYNVYGEFGDNELYNRIFSDEEKRMRFLKWRIRFLERSVRKLDFRVGGVSTIVQVNDLRNSPGIGKWELRQATKQALHFLQDNYPEFVAKQVFINVPWWYMAASKMISPFLTQRSKSKFVVAGPSKSTETLFNYIDAEQVPVQYGGLSRDDGEFTAGDAATQIIIKPGSKETVEFSVTEECQLTWELRVLGWDVSYGAEFVPNAEDRYTVIIQKMKVMDEKEGTVIRNSFKVGEPGRVILTIDNTSSKKKRLLYRLKSKPPCHD